MEQSDIKNELQQIKQYTLLAAKKVLTVPDCAMLTGLSKSRIYKKICAKEIPYYKANGCKNVFFDRDELNAWMLQHRVGTAEELKTEVATRIVTGKVAKTAIGNRRG